MKPDSSSREFFESKYAESPDPWLFETDLYERKRYEETLRAIGPGNYLRGFEAGCSIGVLTAQLAPLCQELYALDISGIAVERAKDRCRHLRNVDIRQGSFPADMPPGNFDLLVLSEVGYYLSPDDLNSAISLLSDRLFPGGLLVAVHWLGRSADHRLTAEEVHMVLNRGRALHHRHSAKFTDSAKAGYLLDTWIRS